MKNKKSKCRFLYFGRQTKTLLEFPLKWFWSMKREQGFMLKLKKT
uniref:Uncharacterized protein n=1 Tax=Brassica oleracea TaxID=3712 RepID=A0A3P6EZH0_BRAOL|nr:unnamed protein product [Brassica oleracea]